MTPRVVGFTPDPFKARIGFCSVELDAWLTVNQIPIFESHGRRWARPPSVSRPDGQGGRIHSDVIGFPTVGDEAQFLEDVAAGAGAFIEECIGAGKWGRR